MSWSQTALDNTRRTLLRSPLHPFRALKRLMPRRLFGRSLIIILAPMLILQAVVTAVFFDRHYRIVTATMTRGVANDVGYMVMLENRLPLGPERDKERQTAAQLFGYPAEFMPGERLTRTVSAPDTVLDRQLAFIFSGQMPQAVNFDTQAFRDYVDLRVQLKDGVLRLLVPRERVTASNADIFILWMIGSSLVLIVDRGAVPAQSGQTHRAACLCGGKFRQGPHDRRIQAAWRDRGAPRRNRVPRDARTHRPLRAAAHRNAGRHQP